MVACGALENTFYFKVFHHYKDVSTAPRRLLYPTSMTADAGARGDASLEKGDGISPVTSATRSE